MLYIVPTPVGNLEDITLRALRILREADLVLAEDTRTTGNLLRHFDIQSRLLSYHKFNEHQQVGALVERLLGGETMALVSDAGTPGISDPGFLLARQCAEAGVEVQCLPGPTAVIPALVASGLPCDRFVFEGFLPQKKGRRHGSQPSKTNRAPWYSTNRPTASYACSPNCKKHSEENAAPPYAAKSRNSTKKPCAAPSANCWNTSKRTNHAANS